MLQNLQKLYDKFRKSLNNILSRPVANYDETKKGWCAVKFSRRGFLKTVAAMGAAAFLDTYGVELAEALNEVKDYWHICWLNGSAWLHDFLCPVSASGADRDIHKHTRWQLRFTDSPAGLHGDSPAGIWNSCRRPDREVEEGEQGQENPYCRGSCFKEEGVLHDTRKGLLRAPA